MNFKLVIYTDENMKGMKRIAIADGFKIPYRVAIYLLSTLQNLDVASKEELLQRFGNSEDALAHIIKETFGVTEDELACISDVQLCHAVLELYHWATDKAKSMKTESSSQEIQGEGKTLAMEQMIFELNKSLCQMYPGLDPLRLLDYPAEDVFSLISGVLEYQQRNKTNIGDSAEAPIRRRPAGDNWF